MQKCEASMARKVYVAGQVSKEILPATDKE